MSSVYVIDTSSLINLSHSYPIDIFPGVWKKIQMLIKEKRLISHVEVLKELSKKDDVLYNWAKRNKSVFKEITFAQVNFVKKILIKFPSLVNENKEHCADPWIIALVLEYKNNPQTKVISINRIIVTEESLKGNKVKIPFVCKEYNIESINLHNMFRYENWIFKDA
jgi:hypothetical protein